MSKDMNHNVSHDINRFIGRVRRWIFLNDLLQALMIAIPAGIGAAAIMEFAAFLTPWYTVHYYAGAAVLLGILTAIAWTIWHYPSKEKDK